MIILHGYSPTANFRKKPKVTILNIDIDNLTSKELLSKIYRGGIVFTPNIDHLVKLQRDLEFYRVYQQADYVICDSQILFYISKFLGNPVVEKISGSDFFSKFYQYYRWDEKIKIFLLGGDRGVADLARENINSKVGRNMIVGACSPSFGFEKNEAECYQIIRQINNSGATVLAVGVGAPKQEKWIARYKQYLPQIKIFLAIGATLDFEAGTLKRSPAWMSTAGLEWLHRLILEPRRLWKRYLFDSIPFFWLLLKQKFNCYHDRESDVYEIWKSKINKRNLSQETQLYRFQCFVKKYNRLAEKENWQTENRINFLVDELPKLANNKLPLGQYLKAAKLLNDNQIEQILAEQKNSKLRFGEIATAKGWVKPVTIEFFLEEFVK